LVADNYFELYINGMIGVDATPFTPFNSHMVRFRVKRPYIANAPRHAAACLRPKMERMKGRQSIRLALASMMHVGWFELEHPPQLHHPQF
jgi:hypothetical protein